jgi:hypothetical protein
MGKAGEDAMREGIKLAKKLQQCIIQCAALAPRPACGFLRRSTHATSR